VLRSGFSSRYVADSGYDRRLAIATMTKRRADMTAFGRPFIDNPDPVERLRWDVPSWTRRKRRTMAVA
jgi:N-ethylmaleimide reductase